MTYNLTQNQKRLANSIVAKVRADELPESFDVIWGQGEVRSSYGEIPFSEFDRNFERGALDALAEAKLLLVSPLIHNGGELARKCTLTALAYRAVDSDFAEDQIAAPVSTLAQPHPPEIAMSLDRLRAKYPDAKKLGFLVMRFAAAKPFQEIVRAIKLVAASYEIQVIRADENEFHADLWGNVRTHLHGCGFGIAVYERIQTDEPNANVGLEVGYLMAMNKPVLLLKDKTVPVLQSDLAGRLYKEFDPHDPEGTIPAQLTKWLEDNGIVLPVRKGGKK